MKYNELAEPNNIVFCWLPSHVGITGNEKADIAAKSALPLNMSDLKIPFTDFKPSINTFVHNKWQMSWNAAVFNELHSIKPSLGEWQPNYRIDRKEEVTLARLRIGHTFITHSFFAERRGLAFVYSLPGTLFSKTLSFRLHRLPHYTFKVLPCQ